MKKVLFVINTLGCAGAEKALLELLRRFPEDQYEVALYVLLGQGEMVHQIPEHVELLNSQYSDASVLTKEGKRELNRSVLRRMFSKGSIFRNLPYILKNGTQMLRKGRIYPDKLLWKVMSDGADRLNEEYDLAIAYLEGGSTYYVHDHVRAKQKMAFLHVDYERAGYTRELDRNCYKDFAKVFTVSDEVKKSFVHVYPEYESKTMVFHNLINREEILRKAQLPGGFQDEYQGKRILTVGRLTAQKAYEIAIDAMKILKDHGVNARWYVLGEGELRDKLQDQIDRLGLQEDFLLLGAVENPYPYYAQCDLYVHATRFEGKSIAIQEAQILGCTLLVSDCSGNREQVTQGVDGMMCNLSPEEISSAVEILLKDEKTAGKYGKMAAKKNLDKRENVLKLFDL